MSELQNSKPDTRWPFKRIALWGLCVLFSSYVFLALADRAVVEMIFVLPFGWLGFCQRVLSGITVNWDLLGMALLCLTVGGVVQHQFLRWVGGYMAKARGGTFAWPVRWTVCGLILGGLFFVIGTTVSAIKQQVEWIKQSDAPKWVQRSPGLASAMKMLAMEMSFEMEDGVESYKILRTKFRTVDGASIYPAFRPPIMHLHGLALFEGEKCVGVILFPRDETLLAKHGGQYVITNSMEWVTPAQLKDVLAKHRDNLRSF